MPFNKTETLLVFRIAGIAFAVPAESVGSIVMPPSHITHAPGSSRSTPGIFHHAEYTYAIIDLHQRFGIDTPRSEIGRLLLQEEGIRHFAFLVDEVVGLIRSEQGKWANLPLYLPRDLFPIGFLHKDEIVLCSELNLLRNMHDAEPLQHHAMQLREATETEEIKTQQTRIETKPETGAIHATAATDITETAPQQKEPREENRLSTPVESSPPMAATPTSQHHGETSQPKDKNRKNEQQTAVIAKPVATDDTPTFVASAVREKPREASVTVTPSLQSREEVAMQRTRHSVTATPALHTAPPRSAEPDKEQAITATTGTHPVEQRSGTRALPWLVLFLLLLVTPPLGYWLWPASEPPQPRYTPKYRAEPAAQPTTSAVTETAPIEEPVPLRIEHDSDGTINLIIDRKAAKSMDRQPPRDEVITATEEQATTGMENRVSAAGIQEAATQTAPSGATEPGPCDCTHIVVRGDTLWDIAERYTGNAFNYPELAKRSGIRNPDRIYPGDRVRIIIR